jgi:hypothetical protein
MKIKLTESQIERLIVESKDSKIKCTCGWSWKKSEGGKDMYVCRKCGHDNTPKSFNEFVEKRLGGATKITNSAHEKGGPSMLTYHHFKVKLPYYEKATEGKFDFIGAEKEFKDTLKKISLDMDQTSFQKEMGRLEVLGELIIKNK